MNTFIRHVRPTAAILALATVTAFASPSSASPLAMFGPFPTLAPQEEAAPSPVPGVSEDSITADESARLPANLRRQVVDYPTQEAPGTIVIDTPNTQLYLVLGGGKAMRYGIGVGREGFAWAGVKAIDRKAEWPDWFPPAEMIDRQPYLPRFMAGGPGNPLGARAMYLGGTEYRIHGTNDPTTIGHRVSSGCIRLTNEDVSDLYSRVKVGAKVVVLPIGGHRTPTDVSAARSLPAGHGVIRASSLY